MNSNEEVRINGCHLEALIDYLINDFTENEWIKQIGNFNLMNYEDFKRYAAFIFGALKNGAEFKIVEGPDDLCNFCPEQDCKNENYEVIRELGLEIGKSYTVNGLRKKFERYYYEKMMW